jgi:hypothetical protein
VIAAKLTPKRCILWGILLTFVGLVAAYAVGSLAMLYDVPCSGRWDVLPGCIELRDRIYRWQTAPLPGLALFIYGVTTAIRRRLAQRHARRRSLA